MMKTNEVIKYLVSWLKQYVENHNLKGFVTGISGGIDSAVTSTLCAKTGLDLLVLGMPILQNTNQQSLARRHIEWLSETYPNVETGEIDLTAPFETIQNTLPPEVCTDLSMANARARLRMLTLYAFASANNLVVAGTGNKVEDFGVGFFTKYGDGGVDISPIADLMKSEVREIAGALGILIEIIEAPPSDGLWNDSRTDEEQIGATYNELEWAMNFHEAGDDEQLLNDRQKEVLQKYRNRRAANMHKMVEIPVAIIPVELKR